MSQDFRSIIKNNQCQMGTKYHLPYMHYDSVTLVVGIEVKHIAANQIDQLSGTGSVCYKLK